MNYYLFNWFLHFSYGVIICGLGVFFIFLSNGTFDDVSSWLYSSRNFLLITIKGLALLTTYKVIEFYKKGVRPFEYKSDVHSIQQLVVFLLLASILKFSLITDKLFDIDSVAHLVSLFSDFALFLILRRYFRKFFWYDLLLISFTQVVVYFVIYQESFYLGLIGMGFFFFLYRFLNRHPSIQMALLCSLSGMFIFNEQNHSRQEVVSYYLSLFIGFFIYNFLQSRFRLRSTSEQDS